MERGLCNASKYLKHDACIYKWACVSLLALIVFLTSYVPCVGGIDFIINVLVGLVIRKRCGLALFYWSGLSANATQCSQSMEWSSVTTYFRTNKCSETTGEATFENNHRCASETYRNINVEVICRYRLMLEQKLKVDFASYFGIKGLWHQKYWYWR